MKLIEQKAELVRQEPGIVGMYKLCELVGRVCFHSEDKITTDSYKEFIDRCKTNSHMSPLEAGTVYLKFDTTQCPDELEFFKNNTYSYVFVYNIYDCFVTTNYRVIVDNGLEQFMNEFWSEPCEFHIPRYCIKSETCIEVYKDLTRHRSHSPMIESTRLCNYMNSKFSRNVTFTNPCWLGYKSGCPEEEEKWLKEKLSEIESIYFEAQERWGWDAQRASYFLPQGTKATMFLTAFYQDWDWMLELRYHQITGKVRPDVYELVSKFKEILEKEYGTVS